MAKTKAEIQRGYEKRTNYEAHKKYVKEKTTIFTMKLFKSTDADIIEQLDTQKNKSGYVKGLIRDDITKRKEEK